MMKKACFAILFALLSNCIWCQEIAKVKLVYGAEGVLLPVSAQCTIESFEYSFGEDLNFLTTYDRLFLEEYSLLSQKLAIDTSCQIDPRIIAISYKKDDSPNDTIYFGEHRGVCKNGQYMKGNKELLNLIKAKIGWKNQYKSILFKD